VFDTFKYGIRYYRYFVWCVWHLQIWHTLLPVFCVVCLTPSNIASITTGILSDVFDTFKHGIRYYRYFVWCVWHLQIWHPLLPVFCVVCLTPSNMASVTTSILCGVFDTFKYGIRYYRYFVWCFVDGCLSFCPFYFGHCIVCPSIYGFWLQLWYIFCIFELFLIKIYFKIIYE
jgi:hypothetical protein